jgi:hypothetical protein
VVYISQDLWCNKTAKLYLLKEFLAFVVEAFQDVGRAEPKFIEIFVCGETVDYKSFGTVVLLI